MTMASLSAWLHLLYFIATFLINQARASNHVSPVVSLRRYDHEAFRRPFIHMLCFEKLSADCCHMLQASIGNWSSISSTHQWNSEEGRQRCFLDIVPVPRTNQDDRAHSQLPAFSFWYAPAEEAVSPSILQPAIETLSLLPLGSRCNLWQWEPRIGDPESLYFRRVEEDSSAVNAHATSRWTVSLESSLSEAGGLHRDLRHRVTLVTQGSPDKSTIPKSKPATFYVFVHLPSDLFVNVEDIFQYKMDSSTGLVVSLVPPLAIIDQEEPSFVSPSHGLSIHVSALIDTTKELQHLEFVTKLHIRYPKPFARGPKSDASFRLVSMPRPELVVARFTPDANESLNSTTIQVQRCFSDPEASLYLQLWVAAGKQRDYVATLSVTILFSLAGAILMLRDIATASVWD